MTKITRDAFLYMEPADNAAKPEAFAQCETCRKYVETKPNDLCAELGPHVKIGGGWSCGLYSSWPAGKPDPKVMAEHLAQLEAAAKDNSGGFVSPEEAGLVDRPVRCQNCYYFDPSKSGCILFDLLNARFPSIFNLNPLVKPLGCCNAQTPR